MPNFTTPLVLLFMFYLFALIKWDMVKRAPFYFLGVLGLLLALVGGFFTLGGSGVGKVARIFEIIGVLVAFFSAVLACAGSLATVQGMMSATKSPPAE